MCLRILDYASTHSHSLQRIMSKGVMVLSVGYINGGVVMGVNWREFWEGVIEGVMAAVVIGVLLLVMFWLLQRVLV